MGLLGKDPESIDPVIIPILMKSIEESSSLRILDKVPLGFTIQENIKFHKKTFLQRHSNGLAFMAFDKGGTLLAKELFFSIGGGFVISEGLQLRGKTIAHQVDDSSSNSADQPCIPYPFFSGEELLARCDQHGGTIAKVNNMSP